MLTDTITEKQRIRIEFKHIISTHCADRCLSAISKFDDGKNSNQRIIGNLLGAYGGSDKDTFLYWQKLYDHGLMIIDMNLYDPEIADEVHASRVYTQAKYAMDEEESPCRNT